MVEIREFRGVIYNPKKVRIEEVVSPPYDVISEEGRNALAQRNPYNIVRLILGKEDGWTQEAASIYQNWLQEGVLIRDDREAIYPYYMAYTTFGVKKEQRGFIARVKVEPFDKGVILPHEKTFSKTVSERLSLLKASQANFSQVYGAYDDPQNEVFSLLEPVISQLKPLICVEYKGVVHKLWRLTDKDIISNLRRLMVSKKVIIADGHHRYRTALAYKEEMRKRYPNAPSTAPFNYVSMYLTNLDDDQLTILPIHRLLPDNSWPQFSFPEFLEMIKLHFDIKKYANESEFWQELRSFTNKRVAIGCYSSDNKENFYLLLLKDMNWDSHLPEVLKKLDVKVLTKIIFKQILGLKEEKLNEEGFIHYVYDDAQATSLIRQGQFSLAFLLNPTTPQQLKQVVLSSYLMPRKSTCFYPKLLTGLVINDLRE